MPKYGYLVVEGPHDVEFIYRLLKPFGLGRVRQEPDLVEFLKPLVPKTYPPGGDLQRRMPTPLFLQSESLAVAVHSASSDTRLVETVEESASVLGANRFNSFTGIGLILDSDQQVPAAERYAAIREGLLAKGFALPDNPGEVSAGPPRFGAFVLPDNQAPGTLEDLLLECAKQVYPNLLRSAATHVAAAQADATLTEDDQRDLAKPAGQRKAIVGSIASVLRPGKAIQVSIQDNRWLRGEALEIPRVKAVWEFLVKLLELN